MPSCYRYSHGMQNDRAAPRAALIAAHSAALPPPITSTSNLRERSTICVLLALFALKANWSDGMSHRAIRTAECQVAAASRTAIA